MKGQVCPSRLPVSPWPTELHSPHIPSQFGMLFKHARSAVKWRWSSASIQNSQSVSAAACSMFRAAALPCSPWVSSKMRCSRRLNSRGQVLAAKATLAVQRSTDCSCPGPTGVKTVRLFFEFPEFRYVALCTRVEPVNFPVNVFKRSVLRGSEEDLPIAGSIWTTGYSIK